MKVKCDERSVDFQPSGSMNGSTSDHIEPTCCGVAEIVLSTNESIPQMEEDGSGVLSTGES